MDLNPIVFFIYGLPLLLAIPLHEAAHGFVAHRCGDPTAYLQGRVTFNPFKHIDPMGTVALPVLLIMMKAPFVFGWAKPVPVDFRKLRHLRRDMVLVAVAGPATNLLLALASAMLLRVSMANVDMAVDAGDAPWYAQMLLFSLLINVTLAVFNMLPILPLDGGRVLTGLLPPKLAAPFARTEAFGFPLLIGLLLLLPLLGQMIGVNLSLFSAFLVPVIYGLVEAIAMLAGIA